MKEKLFKVAFIFLFFAVIHNLAALPSQNVNEYTLENGLNLFLLEDNSTPLVRIEFCVRAGFSSQTKDNAGYFKLYTRLISANALDFPSPLQFSQVQCNADFSRFVINTTAPDLENTINQLSDAIFAADFSEELVTKEFTKMQQEVRSNIENASGFLNAAIDSRVFSDSPWKHDSGIYVPLFIKTKKTSARAILNSIQNKWYTPQNSAIFISGNIKKEEAYSLVQAYFGDYYSSSQKPQKKKENAVNSKRKFVIHDSEFSKEMTQLVIQYSEQQSRYCSLAACTFGSDFSGFKNMLLNLEELGIPGYEYIDASCVQNEDNSRLIIQSILEQPSNKNIKISSPEQAELFVQAIKQSFLNLMPDEFQAAKQKLILNMQQIEESSAVFMEKLSSFWAIEPYFLGTEESFSATTNSITTQELLSQKSQIKGIIQNEFIEDFLTEEPFVFVIVNSADYKKNKTKFDSLGYEEITRKNAVWYNQKIFEEIAKKDEEVLVDVKNDYQKAGNSVFYKENLLQIKKSSLINNIPVTVKYNANSYKMTILLSIRGGQLYNTEQPGFEEVMIRILAANIQNECAKNIASFSSDFPQIDYKTNMTSSYISIECTKNDFELCASCISNALIYGNEAPSLADRIVAAKQYQKRLFNGSAVNQLYEQAIKKLYPQSSFEYIFNAKDDVLTEIQFQQIMNEYPRLLDASRYSVIITGDFPENYDEILNQTLGLLGDQKKKIIIPSYKAEQLKNKRVAVKITHTFLTDIPAEEAPPMPAVLVPTTEFTDPAIYIYGSPDAKSKTAPLFNALLIHFCKLVQEELTETKYSKDASVSLVLPRSQMDSAALIIQNVGRIKEADDAIKNATQKLKIQLTENDKSQVILENIKKEWTVSQMELSGSNEGAAVLLQKGLEYFPMENNTEFYLEEFNAVQNGTPNEYLEAFSFIEDGILLALYSKDSKK